jgi:phosphoglycerate dehydrogenase-like enzyme
MQRVVLHHEAGPSLRAKLAALDEQGLHVEVAADDPAALRAALVDAEILWHVLTPATAAIIEGAPRLRLIQKIGVGLNTIDLAAAARRGIAVCNMPGTNTAAVAEMTLALMLACLRRLPQLDRATRAGRGWALPSEEQDRYGEIGGRTVGLVGMGAVPRRLAPVLDALGAEVVFANRSEHPELPWRRLPIERLLGTADIVSLHLPLVAGTDRLIDEAALARMRPGSILVNTARGGLVDEPALIRALSSGRLAAAGLDVFAEEPVTRENPLLALDTVVLAPHRAWLTQETLGRSIAVAVENCRRLRNGSPLLHQVA